MKSTLEREDEKMKRKFRRIASVLLLAIMCFTNINVYATEVDGEAVELTPEQIEEQERIADMEYASSVPVESNALSNWPQGPVTYGEASIIMDMESGAILYAKNMDARLYPASITKLVTALIALENGNLDDVVTMNEDCVAFLRSDYSQIGLQVGEQLSLREALYATLLASANEAAYAVAANVGEGYDWFINQMNVRAQELGATNTSFVNANGIHDENHFTSVHDMALICSELYKHPEAFEIMQTLEHDIPATNIDPNPKHVYQKHGMLRPEKEAYYEAAIGGKTGYTDPARTTLVTFADNGNFHLVCVQMKTRGQVIYDDTRNMFNYVFDNFSKVPIVEGDTSGDIIAVENDGYVVLPATVTFDQLEREIVESGEIEGQGTVTYRYEGDVVGTAQVTLSETYLNPVEEEPEIKEEPKEPVKEVEEETGLLNGKIIIICGGCLLVILVVLIVVLKRRKRK